MNLRIKKSTTYYVTVLLMIGLSFGFGTLALTGGGLLAADPSLAIAMHDSPLVVKHTHSGEHHQSLLGDLLFGRQALAHAGWYCGHTSRYKTIDGVLHKQVFLYHTAGDIHHIKSAHVVWTGTGYTRISDWYYDKIPC